MNSRLKPESHLGNMWEEDRIELTYRDDFMAHLYRVILGSLGIDVIT